MPPLGTFWNDATASIGNFAGKARRTADDLTASLVKNAEDALELAKKETRAVAEGAEQVYEKAKSAAGSATKAVRAVKDEVTTIVDTLKSARQDVNDPEKLVQSFLGSIPHVQKYLDQKADAISIGYSGEALVGIGASLGAEISYIRAKDGRPARIRVNDLEGEVARISIGAGTRAFVRCEYGDPDTIARATLRTGGELGLLVASAGLYRASVEGEDVAPAKGWTAALGVGGGLGIPIVSDAGYFHVREKKVVTLELTEQAAQKIEAALQHAPDRSWLRERALAL